MLAINQRSISKKNIWVFFKITGVIATVFYLFLFFSITITEAAVVRCGETNTACQENAKKGAGVVCISDAKFAGNVMCGTSDELTAETNKVISENDKLKGKIDISCGFSNIGTDFLKKCILLPMGEAFLTMAASLTKLAGTLLDYSIDYSLNIAKSEKGLMDVVKTVWGTFRDIANMFFIFVLLYIAFATMLQVNGAETKRMLTRLVVVGLLLNFSLFFTQIVIDVSNVLAYNFYTASAQTPSGGTTTTTATGKTPELSVSTPFANHMRLTSLYDTKNQKDFLNTMGTTVIMGTIFLLIAAFVFFAAAIMFIIRTATLIFLMCMAPIAFVMYVLPATQGYAKKWWDALLGQAFVAPIFLLLVWVTLSVMDGLAGKVGGKTQPLAAQLSGKDSFVDVVFIFFLISALMLAALFISKQMAGWTAATAISLAQKGTRFAGKNTLGMAGSGLMRLAAAGKGGKANRLLNMAGAGLRNGSYDVGAVPGAGGLGMKGLKDSKNLAQWWKGSSDDEFKRKGDVFKGIKDPSARLRYLESMGKDDQEKTYKGMSPSERAELRIKDAGLRDRLDGGLSTEDRDKTEGARKTVASADGAEAMIAAIKSGTADSGKEVSAAILKTVGDISKMSVADIKKVASVADKKDDKGNDKSGALINQDVLGKMTPKQVAALSGELDVDNEKAEKFAQLLNDMRGKDGTGADRHLEHLKAAGRTGNAGAELIAKKFGEMSATKGSGEPAAIQRARTNPPSGNIG